MDRSVLGQGVDLGRLARERTKDYRSAEPFAHIVLDGLFSPTVLERLLADFPKPDEIQWRRFQGHNEIKLASSTEDQIPQAIRQFLYQNGYEEVSMTLLQKDFEAGLGEPLILI